MQHMSILNLLEQPTVGTQITVKGWVRSFRSNRFIALNDGSTIATLQCVVDFEKEDEAQLARITTGACLSVTGILAESKGKGQSVEIIVDSFEVLGDAPVDEYPLQPKKHSLEFLREIAHLRPRTNTFGAVFRIRHALSFAIHNYFNKEGFFNWHSPIITGSD
ncbi:MAG: OB-fold nucleic acid binding domain-containing protein, partial [Schleiferiaceae bacterium]